MTFEFRFLCAHGDHRLVADDNHFTGRSVAGQGFHEVIGKIDADMLAGGFLDEVATLRARGEVRRGSAQIGPDFQDATVRAAFLRLEKKGFEFVLGGEGRRGERFRETAASQFLLDRVSSRLTTQSFRGLLDEMDGVVSHGFGFTERMDLRTWVKCNQSVPRVFGVALSLFKIFAGKRVFFFKHDCAKLGGT